MITRFVNGALEFDVDDAGDAPAPAVVLLHGFPQDRASWREVVPRLVAAGRRVLVPELRGYAAGGSPRSRLQYLLDRLAEDVVALADQAGVERFELAGHDWGAALAFHVAGLHPRRVSRLTALSVPHRGAWTRVPLRSGQLLRSWYIGAFQFPWLPELVLHRGIEGMLRRSGLDQDSARRYSDRARRGELDTALNWYRAMPLHNGRDFPRVEVPTLYAWGDGDEFVTEALARLCGEWVDGTYTFEVLRGVRHWIPEVHPDLAAELILRT